jgi:hypothetical protein
MVLLKPTMLGAVCFCLFVLATVVLAALVSGILLGVILAVRKRGESSQSGDLDNLIPRTTGLSMLRGN